MTDISHSHVTLNSVTDDSSTPSNQSEYFSVTSSLDILNCTDDVYFSTEEDVIEKEFRGHSTRSFPCGQIIIENFVDFDEDMKRKLSENQTIEEEIFVHGNGDSDRPCDNLNGRLSCDSVSTDDEDPNNLSTLTDSVNNTFSAGKPDSDNEEDTSLSVNNITQMTNSVIEGELSELNDIVYESSISQDACVIKEEEDDHHDNISLDAEEEELPIVAHETSILELVKRIEFSELDSDTMPVTKSNEIDVREENQYLLNIEKEIKCVSGPNEEKSREVISIVKKNKACEEVDKIVPCQTLVIKEKKTKSEPIATMEEESPVKTSSLCCSIKRKKGKTLSMNSDIQTSKSKSLFSFLKFYKKDRNPLRSPKSLPELNVLKGDKEFCLKAQDSGQYCGVPFIDADVGFYSDAYIPLARQEIFCE